MVSVYEFLLALTDLREHCFELNRNDTRKMLYQISIATIPTLKSLSSHKRSHICSSIRFKMNDNCLIALKNGRISYTCRLLHFTSSTCCVFLLASGTTACYQYSSLRNSSSMRASQFARHTQRSVLHRCRKVLIYSVDKVLG